MTVVTSVCVYCGSGDGADPRYKAAAERLGTLLAQSGRRLVYGGGSFGLMGTVARAAIAAGGKVSGIIPEFLVKRENLLTDCDEILITRDMHERKMAMYQRADAFVALPGGIGTLEELVEQLTWAQLEQHAKPIALADIAGYWAPFRTLIEHMRAERFIRPTLEVPFMVVDEVDALLPALEAAAARVSETRRARADAAVVERM